MDYVYDIETYPNVFTLAVQSADRSWQTVLEISEFRNEAVAILAMLKWFDQQGHRMVGFNNLGFDYPVVHLLTQIGPSVTAPQLYQQAMAIIRGQDEDRWRFQVKPSDRVVEQIDLYRIHHFDNRARATSLKALEFALRMDNVKDLPFPVGTVLNRQQIELLKEYNLHDVEATTVFLERSRPMIEFREFLTSSLGRDFMNHNDTKIGKDYFQMCLEAAGVQCYDYGPEGRQPRQTKRPSINLNDAILPEIQFEHSDLQRVLNWLRNQTITETKGVFTGLSATVNGFEFVFGLGGIHGSVTNRVIESDDEHVILDLDVISYYPSLAITNDFYPEHLGRTFCAIYSDLRSKRVQYPKGTPQNAMLKLALNGVYGDSNNPYSIFFDPLFTMKITLNGQLLLALLAERLMSIPDLEMLQINTDGLTVRVPRDKEGHVEFIRHLWEIETGLSLEEARYSRMFIRDVNNYIAVHENGKVKLKGAYDYHFDWHQDPSAAVVPKVAEQVLVNGVGIRETVMSWHEKMDFMMRAKAPRGSQLVLVQDDTDTPLDKTVRYYVSTKGGSLVKIMPPLARNPGQYRRIGIASGRKVTVCNDIKDAVNGIDYDFYVQEVEKLVMGLC